jgi:hypothetical protein
MFITAGPGTKLCAGGHGGSEGHVLRDTTSRGLRGQVWPPRTSERGDEEVAVKLTARQHLHRSCSNKQQLAQLTQVPPTFEGTRLDGRPPRHTGRARTVLA